MDDRLRSRNSEVVRRAREVEVALQARGIRFESSQEITEDPPRITYEHCAPVITGKSWIMSLELWVRILDESKERQAYDREELLLYFCVQSTSPEDQGDISVEYTLNIHGERSFLDETSDDDFEALSILHACFERQGVRRWKGCAHGELNVVTEPTLAALVEAYCLLATQAKS